MNFFILCGHITFICGLTLLSLRFGLQWLTAWLCLLAVVMNLFVLKQITLFGLSVTPSDALAVGYLLALNLIQEFFGRESAIKCIWISFFITGSFVVLSHLHLLYQPNLHDATQVHYVALLSPAPRLIFASLFSFFVVQCIDVTFFGFLKKKWAGNYLIGRTALALCLSQLVDTVLFSFLGLYGLVASISSIIVFSLIVKGAVILLSTPFISLAKKCVRHVQV